MYKKNEKKKTIKQKTQYTSNKQRRKLEKVGAKIELKKQECGLIKKKDGKEMLADRGNEKIAAEADSMRQE